MNSKQETNMNADECIINEKALELIDRSMDYELIYDAEADFEKSELTAVTLGMIRGILDMAGALKGELKNEQKNIR